MVSGPGAGGSDGIANAGAEAEAPEGNAPAGGAKVAEGDVQQRHETAPRGQSAEPQARRCADSQT